MRTTRHRGLAGLIGTGVLATGLALTTAGTAVAADDTGAGDIAVTQTNLVSNQPGQAPLLDPTLKNPWGMSFGTGATPTPLWVSENGSDASTLYRNNATPPPPLSKLGLTVAVPVQPTGQVFNPTSDFVVSVGAASGSARFIFATESGSILGWNPNVPAPGSTDATPAAHVNNAVYKGLALASAKGKNFLYAANFHSGRVDVFDSSFMLQNWHGAFRDRHIPRGYAPFNVQLLNGDLYVTYAKQQPNKVDDAAGAGHGFVDIFSTSGHLERRLVKKGALNSPWGLAIAPSSWGNLAGALLVGNFGDGRINAYGAKSGRFMGPLRDAAHQAIAIDGLWGLLPGNGVAGDPQAVLFSAGPNEEADGLLGALTSAAAGGDNDD
ncbi:MAG: hypothetical protein QOJ62_1236 [Actinomycetota bacterium]|nr:hypothetical protein [Actinomycetota bacterium]